jgi:hypothetical protein
MKRSVLLLGFINLLGCASYGRAMWGGPLEPAIVEKESPVFQVVLEHHKSIEHVEREEFTCKGTTESECIELGKKKLQQ